MSWHFVVNIRDMGICSERWQPRLRCCYRLDSICLWCWYLNGKRQHKYQLHGSDTYLKTQSSLTYHAMAHKDIPYLAHCNYASIDNKAMGFTRSMMGTFVLKLQIHLHVIGHVQMRSNPIANEMEVCLNCYQNHRWDLIPPNTKSCFLKIIQNIEWQFISYTMICRCICCFVHLWLKFIKMFSLTSSVSLLFPSVPLV